MIYFLHGVVSQNARTAMNSGGKHISVNSFHRLLRYSGNRARYTFDDGFQGIYRYAYPKLRNGKIPFTIFLTTEFIVGKRIWTDELAILSQDASFVNRAVAWAELHDRTRLKEYRSYATLRVHTKSLGRDVLRSLMAYLNEQIDVDELPVPSELFDPLSTDQIGEMLQSGLLTLGGHTTSHPILSSLSYDEQYQDIKANKDWIEDTFKVKIVDFAYPNGKLTDFNQDTIDILRQVGYEKAYTTVPSYDEDQGKPWQIPRIGISADLANWQLWLIAKKLYPVRA
jgi:peptidoglycan/xylan/chitin deacetylase (PgdA/CDA1 family)